MGETYPRIYGLLVDLNKSVSEIGADLRALRDAMARHDGAINGLDVRVRNLESTATAGVWIARAVAFLFGIFGAGLVEFVFAFIRKQ